MGARLRKLEGTFDEGAVLRAFADEGLAPSRWSNGPGDAYAPHSHGYHKVLYCLAGSITFRLRESGERLELQRGDRLDIEPGTVHEAVVGPGGVTCIEAPRR
ncbi:MAG TPA: cupin domain-containing protein [Dehalococcoidia bacterium]|nr:cupin domain-containing protein [Dehalococcoidia bacterium]